MRTSVVALLAIFALNACSAQNAQKAFHENFRKSYKTSFMRSCIGSRDPRAVLRYCTCADNKIESQFTDAELIALSPSDPRVLTIVHDCATSSFSRPR